MRTSVLLTAVLLGLSGFQPAAIAEPQPQSPTKLDHILLWGRSIDEVTSILSVKLGFQVRPGHDTGGVANRYVRIADRGFIELLGITRPNPDLDPGSKADQASLRGGAGARSFGIYSPALEQARATLSKQGFNPTPIFSSPNVQAGQPDWRLFAFERSPLSSGLFFIDYSPAYAMPTSVEDDQIVRTHPNGARALSAFWLLSADAEANRKQLAKLGYGGAKPVRLPQIGARGFCVPVGPTSLFALEPDGDGMSADALRKGGPQVLGVSIGVAELGRAQRWVERGYDQKLKTYEGTLGTSVLAPTLNDLGVLIEFHAEGHGGGACAAGQGGSPKER